MITLTLTDLTPDQLQAHVDAEVNYKIVETIKEGGVALIEGIGLVEKTGESLILQSSGINT